MAARSVWFALLTGLLFVAAQSGHVLRAPRGPAVAADRLPVYFIENRGQADPRAAYYVKGRGSSFYFTSRGIRMSLTGSSGRKRSPLRLASIAPTLPVLPATRRHSLELDFVGARPVRPIGEDSAGVRFSYFNGPRERWKSGLRSYRRLLYRNLWPGIDLVYSGAGSTLKHDFVVHPGADPAVIRLAYRGADSLSIDARGGLEIGTSVGTLHDLKPFVYQEKDGRRVEVSSSYVLNTPTPQHPETHAYGFRVGAYDHSRPLILDPVMFLYSGYIGGSGFEFAYGIAVDSLGHAYVTGETDSPESTFPEAVGPDLTFNGTFDAFIAKVNPAGTGLVYCGYIGGAGNTSPRAVAVDSSGSAYVAGSTSATQATFPVAVGPDLTHNGGNDGFVAKVNASGTALDYCGYIGGAADDQPRGVAVDSLGKAHVTGYTFSDQTTFPVIGGPDLTHNGSSDVFVARLDAAGSELEFCGYIGGSTTDAGFGMAVDTLGNAYVAGLTGSDQTTFPVSVGPDLTYNGSSSDAFVVKVSSSGTALLYCGYIGGASGDFGLDVAVDGTGRAFVVGDTLSNQSSFPVTVGPDLTYNGAVRDAFVARVNAGGTALEFCGYIGGDDQDNGTGVAVDGSGRAVVSGRTFSSQATFPVACGPDLILNGFEDGFVARLNVAGTALEYCGYIGGIDSDGDEANGVAVDAAGNAYLTGVASSSEATFPVVAGPDLTFNGGDFDGFVTKVGELDSVVTVTASDAAASEFPADPGVFTVTRTGDTTSALTVNFAVSGTAVEGTDYGAVGTSVNLSAGTGSAQVTVTPTADALAEGAEAATLTLAPGGGYTIGSPAAATVTIANYSGGRLQVPPKLNFGKVRPPAARTKPLTVRNLSTTQSLIIAVDPTTPAPPYSLLSGGGTVIIAPRGSHRLMLRFAPPARGRANGTLRIAGTDPAKPSATVGLSGTGR